jgi:transcriptional regulator with XRE-family HTH domain
VTLKTKFDAQAFYKAVEATMLARGLNWKQVGAETGIGVSTLSRMRQGTRPDAASLAALAAWSGLNPGHFVRGIKRTESPAPLAALTASLHSDPLLSEESAVAIDELLKATYERLARPTTS